MTNNFQCYVFAFLVQICKNIIKNQRECEEGSDIFDVLISNRGIPGWWEISDATEAAGALARSRVRRTCILSVLTYLLSAVSWEIFVGIYIFPPF